MPRSVTNAAAVLATLDVRAWAKRTKAKTGDWPDPETVTRRVEARYARLPASDRLYIATYAVPAVHGQGFIQWR